MIEPGIKYHCNPNLDDRVFMLKLILPNQNPNQVIFILILE